MEDSFRFLAHQLLGNYVINYLATICLCQEKNSRKKRVISGLEAFLGSSNPSS
jgi:hypothetical protein